MSTATATTHWIVKLDEQGCSLCEICTNHCPTGALSIDKGNETLGLLFAPDLCNGCEGEESCEALCPEKVLHLEGGEGEAPPADTEPVMLLRSEMARCTYCGELFAPICKLEVMARKGQEKHERCPICRRTHLVVNFIEEHRVPGSKAEYRSTRDILRRAGYDRWGKR